MAIDSVVEGMKRLKARPSREHGLLPLPAGERGGVRGLRSRGWFPLTPTLSPLGRGSPAVPQIEAVLITKVWIEMNGTCSSCGLAARKTHRHLSACSSKTHRFRARLSACDSMCHRSREPPLHLCPELIGLIG